MKCKNCNHKIVIYAKHRDGEDLWKHIWENDLGYCQVPKCGCDEPEPNTKNQKKTEKGK